MTAEMLQDRIPGVEWTATSASVTEDLSYEQYEDILRQAFVIGDAVRWWIGDLLIFGESRYGERYAQALTVARVGHDSLVRYQRVAARIEPRRRRQNLSFSHHAEVSMLEGEVQARLLESAEANAWSVAELRQQVKDSKLVARIESVRRPKQEVLGAEDTVGAVAGLATVRESLEASYLHLRDPDAHPALETAQTIAPALRALEEASDTVTAAARVVDSQNALDRACRYYREALEHVLEECGNDAPRIDHIREAATRGISAADHELKEHDGKD